MTKQRKVDLLYKKATGQRVNATPEELKELRKYKVSDNGNKRIATRANISAYISAVDKGTRISFYDWCLNHGKADRRRKGSSKKDMKADLFDEGISVIGMGWLVWGLALYWIQGGAATVGSCAVMGAVIAAILYFIGRDKAIFTLFLLPIILAMIFFKKN